MEVFWLRRGPTSTSLLPLFEKTAEWKMCIFLCAVSQCAAHYPTLRPDAAAFVALAVITLARHQHTTHCFSCLCFSTCTFGDAEKCLRVVQRSQPCRVFYFSVDSALKCFRWPFPVRHVFAYSHLYICCKGKYQNHSLCLSEHTYSSVLCLQD